MFLFFFIRLFAENAVDNYFENLKKIKDIENRANKRLPVIYNQMCEGGYLAMPSSRMKESGVIGTSYFDSDPYKILGFNLQYFSRLEISANVWIFKKILEGSFGKMGFGEDADRTANIKLALLKNSDGFEYLPEIAVGINDFFGSRRFHSKYLVLTKQFTDQNFELTLGVGKGRINGFFAGAAYFPFLNKKNNLYRQIALFAEYDGNNYKKHEMEHPSGRDVRFPVNLGINFQFNDIFQSSISTLRGKKISASFCASYNLGQTKGIFPKYLDPPLFCNYSMQGQDNDMQRIAQSFKDQGFDLVQASSSSDFDNRNLYLTVINLKYRSLKTVKCRIRNLISFLPLDEYEKINIFLQSDGIALYEYIFKKSDLVNYQERKINIFELDSICAIQDPTTAGNDNCKILYERKKANWMLTVRPKVNAFFSSCRGKFKYDGGFLATQEGFVFKDLYYNFQTSYIIKSASAEVGSRDKYNPSQLINVRSDFVKYFETNSFHIDNLYIQKNYNLKKALFGKISLGYFELAYAGIDVECLFYPVNSFYGASIELANVYKREYHGMGFQKKIRKWNNTSPEYVNFIGYQYFLNLFLEIKPLDVSIKTTIGQFLAKDVGVKFEIFRYFKSGLDVSCWITFTNGNDRVNNQR
ncbi:MAG: YjbH domain-containing protein, partial [Parachlamydiales bacterium]